MKLQSPLAIGSFSLKSVMGLLFVLNVALVAGCSSTGQPKARPLMPTPVLYQQEPLVRALFADTAPERRTPGVELLYITDRTLETNPESNQPYGEGRSKSLTFGTAMVEMVPGLTWSDLEYQSRLPKRTRDITWSSAA